MFGLLSCRKKFNNPTVSQEDSQSVDLENALEELSTLEKSLQEGANHPDNKDLTVLEEFDITKDLGAIVYTSKIDNKLCNFKKIIENIQIGFKNMKCTQPKCNKKATIYVKYDDDTPTVLYCKIHSQNVNFSKVKYSFNDLLINQILILNYLERLLIVIHEQMGYLESENFKLDQAEYKLDNKNIDIEYNSLVSRLKIMVEKSEAMIINEKVDKKVIDTKYLLRFKDYSEQCVQTAIMFLKSIFEVNLKPKIESKVKMILNSNKALSQSENKKINIVDSVPDEIYGREIELCKIPTQYLNNVKNLYNKLHGITKNAIANQKRSEQMAKNVSKAKEILIREIKKREIVNEEIKTQQIEGKQKPEDNSKENAKSEEQINIDKINEIDAVKNSKEKNMELVKEDIKKNEEPNDEKLCFGWLLVLSFLLAYFVSIYGLENKLDKCPEVKPESCPENIGPLSLRREQFYRDNLEVTANFTKNFEIASNTYYKLGQFEYKQSDFLLQPIRFDKYTSTTGYKCFAIGQLEEGTNVLHGVGIIVCDNGFIGEGYWEHGRRNGQGRYIWEDGDYYIGEFKEGVGHGQGTYYNKDGTVLISGKWENNKFVG